MLKLRIKEMCVCLKWRQIETAQSILSTRKNGSTRKLLIKCFKTEFTLFVVNALSIWICLWPMSVMCHFNLYTTCIHRTERDRDKECGCLYKIIFMEMNVLTIVTIVTMLMTWKGNRNHSLLKYKIHTKWYTQAIRCMHGICFIFISFFYFFFLIFVAVMEFSNRLVVYFIIIRYFAHCLLIFANNCEYKNSENCFIYFVLFLFCSFRRWMYLVWERMKCLLALNGEHLWNEMKWNWEKSSKSIHL